MEVKEYELIICGAGPAGISPLVYLDDKEELNGLLEKGICVIDAAPQIGEGSIGKYLITANSLGDVFLEVFNNPNGELYSYLTKQSSYKKILPFLEAAPPLPLIGSLLTDIGRFLSKKIEDSKNSDLYTLSNVVKIQQRRDGKYEITIIPRFNTDKLIKVVSKKVLFNLGGKQFPPSYLDNRNNSWQSGDFLKGHYDDIVLDYINNNKPINITILGGSHSAFSCLFRLKNQLNALSNLNVQVNIIHRSSIRLFYNSKEEAEKDSYNFDKGLDVCLQSGRINRYSGLRYDSFNLGKEVLNKKYNNVNLIKDNSENYQDSRRLIQSSDVVLLCNGYQNRTVDIVDSEGNKLTFKMGKTLETDKNYNPILTTGEPLQNFFSYGLGSGPKTGTLNGGEISFDGRIDGIWVYQNEVAPRIFN